MRTQFALKRRLGLIGILATTCLLQSVEAPLAATATTTFSVSVTLAATCTINSASALSFGNQGILATNVDQTSTIQVTCTNTTPYNIGLDAGTGSGATVAARLMTASGATVTYSLYQDSAHSNVWGNSIGTNTVAGTGNGTGQSYTVYGRVPPQTTPAPGTYSDTVTVTVTY
ncbi:MAG TPA: spore coat U domain-containing protein [Xanthobacteraceae bacterium]|nr:spore coat U domain-containing protein [Xanthobacteraceae bacterium]